MSTITKELAKLFRKITNSEIDAEGNAHVVLSPADSLLINNARIALASLEAEAVACIDQANLDYLESGDATVWPATSADAGDVLLYSAPQPLTTSERAELENYRNAQQVVPGDIDARMKSAGMLSASEIIAGQPIDAFLKHAGVVDMGSLLQWSEMRRAEFLRMQAKYELGDYPKDDMYEWVISHAAAFSELHVNIRAAMLQSAEPEIHAYALPTLDCLDTVKFNADCAIQDPESIYANEFFLSLDEVFGEIGNYSEPVQAKAVSMLIAEVFRLRGYSPAAPQQEQPVQQQQAQPQTQQQPQQPLEGEHIPANNGGQPSWATQKVQPGTEQPVQQNNAQKPVEQPDDIQQAAQSQTPPWKQQAQ